MYWNRPSYPPVNSPLTPKTPHFSVVSTSLSTPVCFLGHPVQVLESRGQKLEAARSAAASWWVTHVATQRVARGKNCGFYKSV